jgi:hypothetical protein
MNRMLCLGIAVFLAMVGLALVGGERQAVASSGCCGISTCCGMDAGKDCGGRSWGMRRRCHGRVRRGCDGCWGVAQKGAAQKGVAQKGVEQKGAAQKGGAIQQGGMPEAGGDLAPPPAPVTPPASALLNGPPRLFRIVFRR